MIYALQERIGSHVEDEDVEAAIAASDRQRYEIKDDKIRALYGHSFPIDPGEPTEPPDELFIGVGSRDAARAEEKGLRSGRRAFLHLARTEEEAREAGRRAAREYAVITVFAGEAFDEGIDSTIAGASSWRTRSRWSSSRSERPSTTASSASTVAGPAAVATTIARAAVAVDAVVATTTTRIAAAVAPRSRLGRGAAPCLA